MFKLTGPPREFRGPGAKEKDQAHLRAKRAESFQGLDINFEKFLLVYFMKPPDLKAEGVTRSLGA